MLDLIVAAGLGITTNPGPAFLVPLAFTLYVVSLWQLAGGRWAGPRST